MEGESAVGLSLSQRKPSDWGMLRTRAFRARAVLGRLFYTVGADAEYRAVLAWRGLRAFFGWVGGLLAQLFGPAFLSMAQALRGMRRDITEPVHRARSGAGHIRELVADEKKNGRAHALRLGWQYFRSGVHRYGHLGKNLFYYLLPLAAGGVFVFTVVNTLGSQFALAVHYRGQIVGYVGQESVYEEAEQIVENQMVYTGNEQSWDLHPTFALTAARPEQLSDSQTLVDAILRSSGAEITEAVGLYVNNVFYGATTEIDRLKQAIEAIKAPYETQYPGAEISFVQQVDLKKGVYLTESVKKYDELSSLLTAEVSGQRSYTIQSGDTPWAIAGANGITLDDLYALNPILDNGNSMPVGETLVIGQAVPFLQVKAVVTSVEREEIPYETTTEYSTDLAFGVQKVRQEGVAGQKDVTYETTYVGGQVTERKAVGEPVVLSQPVTKEVVMGSYMTSAGTVVKPGNGVLMFPISAGYKGMSRGYSGPLLPAHNGLDLRGYVGSPLYAAQSGVVIYAGQTRGGYGIHVIIDHGGGLQTLYGHCSGLAVTVGQVVQQGQLIAYLGSTGWSTGPHCHFEVRVNGVARDPMLYLG
mgnify:CR=1 FL=1